MELKKKMMKNVKKKKIIKKKELKKKINLILSLDIGYTKKKNDKENKVKQLEQILNIQEEKEKLIFN